MSLCAACGDEIYRGDVEIVPGGGALCAYHARGGGGGWAENNRRMCDLLHWGRVPPRLPPAEREDEFCAHVGVA